MATQPKEVHKKNNSLRDFQGVNTQAARQVIGDDQFAWLENVQPIGFGNMVAMPGPSDSLASWSGTMYMMSSVNLAGIDYMIVLCATGAAYAVNLATYAVTTIAAAATLNGSSGDVAQWENTYAIIVDPSGYYTWNLSAGLQKWNGIVGGVVVTTPGTGYTSVPTIGYSGGGGGSGFAITLNISVGLATITAGGTGYNVGDIVTMAGGTSTTEASVVVSAVTAGGVISGINLSSVGVYTVAPANPASSTSPYGSGATFTLNFSVGPVSVLTAGSGYTAAPTIGLTGGGGTGGVVTASLAVVPPGGTSVATYAGYVWVGAGRTVEFSAPSSYNDFSTANGGGSFIIVDETLHSNINAMVSANDFLYIAGSSSFNIIGNVSVTSTGTTVFSNTNLSASIGSSQQFSVIPYYRGLWFQAPYGFFVLYGSTTQKASDDLDGVFPLITSAIPVSSGLCVLNDVLTLAFMFKYNDASIGPRTLFACFSNKKWFFASQGNSLTFCATAIINGSPILYASDGSKLYSLFTNTSVSTNQTIKTKLWDMGDPLANKQALKFGLEVINPVASEVITGTIDTEIMGGQIPISLSSTNYVQWVNSSNQVVQWQNNVNQIVQWLTSGYAFIPLDIQTTGRYLGVSLYGYSIGTTYAGLHLQYEHRAQWPQEGPM